MNDSDQIEFQARQYTNLTIFKFAYLMFNLWIPPEILDEEYEI
jgi:hypothetical protein